jgi:DNA-binding NtrC family response regulator
MKKGHRILIVEDQAGWREDIFRETLEDRGYRVSTSDSYQGAIDTLDHGGFDLVIVDVNLTGVSGNQDGIRIVEQLAARGDMTPVIVVSGSKTRDAARQTLKQYAPVAFIDKTTFDIDQFVQTVAEALG